MYVLSTGCQWGYVPKDLPPSAGHSLGFSKRNLWPAPPKSTLYKYFELWTYARVGDYPSCALYEVRRTNRALLMVVYI